MTVAEIEAILDAPPVTAAVQAPGVSVLGIVMALFIALFAAGAICQLAPWRWRLSDWLKVGAVVALLATVMNYKPADRGGPDRIAEWCAEMQDPRECERMARLGVISPPASFAARLFGSGEE